MWTFFSAAVALGEAAPVGRPTEPWLSELRAKIFDRDGHRCVYCGSGDALVIDHFIPLIRGGTNHEANLVTACEPCNCSKGGKTFHEWRGC